MSIFNHNTKLQISNLTIHHFSVHRYWKGYLNSDISVLKAQLSDTAISVDVIFQCHQTTKLQHINTLGPRQNGHHFPDDILKWIFLDDIACILVKISQKFGFDDQYSSVGSDNGLAPIRLAYWRLYVLLGLNELITKTHYTLTSKTLQPDFHICAHKSIYNLHCMSFTDIETAHVAEKSPR